MTFAPAIERDCIPQRDGLLVRMNSDGASDCNIMSKFRTDMSRRNATLQKSEQTGLEKYVGVLMMVIYLRIVLMDVTIQYLPRCAARKCIRGTKAVSEMLARNRILTRS